MSGLGEPSVSRDVEKTLPPAELSSSALGAEFAQAVLPDRRLSHLGDNPETRDMIRYGAAAAINALVNISGVDLHGRSRDPDSVIDGLELAREIVRRALPAVGMDTIVQIGIVPAAPGAGEVAG